MSDEQKEALLFGKRIEHFGRIGVDLDPRAPLPVEQFATVERLTDHLAIAQRRQRPCGRAFQFERRA